MSEEEKKICPFMNKGIPGADICIYCLEEKCMAWGFPWVAADGKTHIDPGCKLIERLKGD